jgi:hypothetical protein
MAAQYLFRVVRRPITGKSFELLDAIVEQRSANTADPRSFVLASIASPRTFITTSTRLDDLDELQVLVENAFDSEETRANWDKLAALTSSTATSLSRIVKNMGNVDDANFIQRYTFRHDSNSRPQLIAALEEFSGQGDASGIGITASLNSNLVVASQAVKNLSDLGGPFDRLRDDAAIISRGANVLVHCSDWKSSIVKILR